MKTLYLIGGPMGVGKTAVSKELKRMLDNSVFLDGDWCWDADPFVVNEETKQMVMDNICYLLGNFLRASVYENVIFCWVMHEQWIVDEILSRLPLGNCRVCVCSLVASEEALRERLLADIAAGLRTEDVIARSLARLPLYDAMKTVRIDTTGMTVPMVAERIAAL